MSDRHASVRRRQHKINGFNIKTEPVRAKSTFGFVSDRHDVFVKMTGLEYLAFMADAYGVDEKTRLRRIEYLDKVFRSATDFWTL